MATPERGDSIELTTDNRDEVITFIHACSEWVAAHKPSSLDDPPVIDPNSHSVIVEGLHVIVDVNVGDTVVYVGKDEIAIRNPQGGESMITLEGNDPPAHGEED